MPVAATCFSILNPVGRRNLGERRQTIMTDRRDDYHGIHCLNNGSRRLRLTPALAKMLSELDRMTLVVAANWSQAR
jgi:hypothetical protein